MANITEILGTDSVSSSRPVLNSNFELLNDEMASITALLDPSTLTLSQVGLSSISSISLVASGGQSIASINATEALFEVDATFTGAIKIGNKLIKNGIIGSPGIGTSDNSPAGIEASTYFVDSAFALPPGDEGQEVTLISATATPLQVTANTVAGASLGVNSIELQGAPVSNASVTLRCFNSIWHVIGSYGATIA